MGIKERRDRERQELKQSILVAAREIAAQDGWQAVTIRKVADRIEYSPPTIYEHFESKEAILQELIHEGFQALFDGLYPALTSPGDPEARLLRMAGAYWEFAWKHPELYQVMHGLDGVPFCSEGTQANAEQTSCVLEELLQSLAPAAMSSVGNRQEAVDVIWGTLHGLISLTMAQHIGGGRERGARLAEQAMRTLIGGWRAAGAHS
jgi:AcrR family transcriptional regulator